MSGPRPNENGTFYWEKENEAEHKEATHIVYTHHHWDHVSGACSFDVPIIAHETCQEILLEEAKKPWNSEYLREEIKRNPKLRVSCEARERAIKSWEGFRFVIPDRLFARSMQFRVGNIDLWFEHVGGNHAVDSIIVKVPAEGIMFLGDCYYPPPLHLRDPTSTISKIMLASIENKGFTLYVEGHDDPFTRAELLEFLEEE